VLVESPRAVVVGVPVGVSVLAWRGHDGPFSGREQTKICPLVTHRHHVWQGRAAGDALGVAVDRPQCRLGGHRAHAMQQPLSGAVIGQGQSDGGGDPAGGECVQVADDRLQGASCRSARCSPCC
jgi:hypothetical protein